MVLTTRVQGEVHLDHELKSISIFFSAEQNPIGHQKNLKNSKIQKKFFKEEKFHPIKKKLIYFFFQYL